MCIGIYHIAAEFSAIGGLNFNAIWDTGSFIMRYCKQWRSNHNSKPTLTLTLNFHHIPDSNPDPNHSHK